MAPEDAGSAIGSYLLNHSLVQLLSLLHRYCNFIDRFTLKLKGQIVLLFQPVVIFISLRKCNSTSIHLNLFGMRRYIRYSFRFLMLPD